MNNNITIRVTLESEGPSEFGAVKSTNSYTVFHICQKYETLHNSGLDAGKARALKLISKALRTKASVLIEAEWYAYSPGEESKDLGEMWIRAHAWGTKRDIYERSGWKTDTVCESDADKPATMKALLRGLNNLLMTVTDTIKNWESI